MTHRFRYSVHVRAPAPELLTGNGALVTQMARPRPWKQVRVEVQRSSRAQRRGGSLRNASEALQGGPDQPKCHLILSFIGLGQRKRTNVLLSNTLK